MASEHTARAYDEELRRLSNTVAEMGGLAESQLGTAIEAVMTRDTELAARVVEGDVKVDQLERELDNLAIRLLALRQPVARDLREIFSALKIASDLERIGDYAANV
ncbi:MAG: PhoU domain-containing protein, partial [Stellaceae bacterium]